MWTEKTIEQQSCLRTQSVMNVERWNSFLLLTNPMCNVCLFGRQGKHVETWPENEWKLKYTYKHRSLKYIQRFALNEYYRRVQYKKRCSNLSHKEHSGWSKKTIIIIVRFSILLNESNSNYKVQTMIQSFFELNTVLRIVDDIGLIQKQRTAHQNKFDSTINECKTVRYKWKVWGGV